MQELHWLGLIKSPVDDEIVGYHFVLFSSVLLLLPCWLWDKQPAEIQGIAIWHM